MVRSDLKPFLLAFLLRQNRPADCSQIQLYRFKSLTLASLQADISFGGFCYAGKFWTIILYYSFSEFEPNCSKRTARTEALQFQYFQRNPITPHLPSCRQFARKYAKGEVHFSPVKTGDETNINPESRVRKAPSPHFTCSQLAQAPLLSVEVNGECFEFITMK